MLTIKVKNVDMLDNFCRELVMLTFLQDLILNADYEEYGKEFDFINMYAKEFLHKNQIETVFKLRDFLNSKDFTEKIK